MAAIATSVNAVLVMTTTSAMMQSVMKVSVTAIFVMAISEGSGRCIGDGSIGDDHVSGDEISDEFGDNIGDEYIRDSYVSDDCQ